MVCLRPQRCCEVGQACVPFLRTTVHKYRFLQWSCLLRYFVSGCWSYGTNTKPQAHDLTHAQNPYPYWPPATLRTPKHSECENESSTRYLLFQHAGTLCCECRRTMDASKLPKHGNPPPAYAGIQTRLPFVSLKTESQSTTDRCRDPNNPQRTVLTLNTLNPKPQTQGSELQNQKNEARPAPMG